MTQDSTAERRRARMAFMDDKKGTQAMTAPIIYIRQEPDTAHAGTWCDVPDGGTPYVPQAAIAAAMMGAVKPLEWESRERDRQECFSASCFFGDYQIDWNNKRQNWELGRPRGAWRSWEAGFSWHNTIKAAKAAAEADWQARNAAIRVIPTDAMAALDAVKALAEQRGFNRAKEQAAQIIKTAYPCETGNKWAAQIRAMEGSE